MTPEKSLWGVPLLGLAVTTATKINWKDVSLYIALPIIAGLLWMGFDDFKSVKLRQIQMIELMGVLRADVSRVDGKISTHLEDHRALQRENDRGR